MQRDADHLSAGRRASLLAVTAGIALLATACGGSSSTGSGGAAGPPSPPAGSPGVAAPPGSQKDLLAFKRCMRSHGVANFPGPASQGGASTGGATGNSPALPAAIKACQHLLPNGGVAPAQPGMPGAGSAISG
jgi:hypothetical protein